MVTKKPYCSYKKNRHCRIRGDGALSLLLLPSIMGLLIFYIVPFILSIYNAVIDNPANRNFVGLQNFAAVIGSESFHLALFNTVIFTGVCVVFNLVFPFAIALLLNRIKVMQNFFWLIFLLPMVIPSGSMVFLWQKVFGLNGLINLLFFKDIPKDWINSPVSFFIIVFIFLWKYAGYNIVLLFAGLNQIPNEYYEYAEVEGAGNWRKFTSITLIYLTPAAFLAFVMALINSSKIYREIFSLAGAYPHQNIYLLQHYMYNQFSAINYQKLASSSYIVTVGFVLVVLCLFFTQRKISENF
ncbi:MAG: sugar ABC transporter permease [Lachnospiraceae bacterium]|nr:sugar ABC transporter permease [Lachnospiraceae bacterium]